MSLARLAYVIFVGFVVMNFNIHIFKVFFLLVMYQVFFPNQAHAYIDPGTGSLILQALAAGVFTALAFWRNLREKIINIFKSKKTDEEK